MDHAMNHLAYAFLLNLKHIMCNNTVYKLYEAALVNVPPIRSLHCAAQTNALPFVFSEIHTAVMMTLNK